MIKGIIFDLDGTLLNTIADLNNSVNDTYDYFGYEKYNTEEVTMSMVGHGMRKLVEKCFEGESEAFIDKALNVFLEMYDKQYANKTCPYNGIQELIKSLEEREIIIGINSNKNHNYTQYLINKNFPSINNKYIRGLKENDKTKPDPTNVNAVVAEMGLDKEEILYVGDSPTDLLTAKNANLKFIAVSWGFRSKEKLLEAGAEILIDNPGELLKYF